MRLLVVSPRFPGPVDSGDRLTVFKFLEYLAPRHELTLVCQPPTEDAELGRATVRKLARVLEVPRPGRLTAAVHGIRGALHGWPVQAGLFSSPAFVAAVRGEVERSGFDIVYGHTIRVAEALRPLRGVPRVLNYPLSWGLNYRRLIAHTHRPDWRAMYAAEYALVRRYEAKLSHEFELNVVISETDRQFIQRHGGAPERLLVNPHGVDHRAFVPSNDSQRAQARLVFSGTMWYPPNVDAALYFAQNILPRVRSAVPEVQFQIVGARPDKAIRDLARSPMIEVTGKVPVITPYLQQGTIAVDPLRVGAGLQNKVIEAMACATPVVATTIANEGIGAPAPATLRLADTPDAFADAVVGLLRDPAERRRLGASARQWVETQFTWEYFFERLEQHMTSLADVPVTRPAPHEIASNV